MTPDRREWPVRGLQWIDAAWIAFAVANLAGMLVFASWETVPFHFIWVSLTLLYGFRVWALRRTMVTLAAVMVTTAGFILIDVSRAAQPIDEITEVPLMAAMFVAMVWHARRRASAMEQTQRMYEANARLLDRERRFIQDASHELRTPITVALGHAELIHKGAGDALVAEDARVVVDELMRLRRLADRLLLLAASEHPGFLRRSRLDVESTVVDTVRRWTPVERRWVLGEVEEAAVDADADRLALALDALIENAVKHTGPEDSITFSVRRRDGVAIIGVADTGTGISPEDQSRIFDRFARPDSGRSREGGGVGLGLAIVKTVAEAHGGWVAVRSDPGKGSVFELALPVSGSPARSAHAELGAGAPTEPG
ncbi:MAG: sensor histidine kinase [Actinomycetota bacterium]